MRRPCSLLMLAILAAGSTALAQPENPPPDQGPRQQAHRPEAQGQRRRPRPQFDDRAENRPDDRRPDPRADDRGRPDDEDGPQGRERPERPGFGDQPPPPPPFRGQGRRGFGHPQFEEGGPQGGFGGRGMQRRGFDGPPPFGMRPPMRGGHRRGMNRPMEREGMPPFPQQRGGPQFDGPRASGPHEGGPGFGARPFGRPGFGGPRGPESEGPQFDGPRGRPGMGGPMPRGRAFQGRQRGEGFGPGMQEDQGPRGGHRPPPPPQRDEPRDDGAPDDGNDLPPPPQAD